MEFTILGPTELHVGGRAVDLGSAKQRGLLTLLLYHVGKPVSAASIVEQLWKVKTRDEVRASLYQLVSRIRTTFERVGVPGTVVTLPDAYRLDLDPGLVDLHRFGRMVDEAREAARGGRHDTVSVLLSEAVDLWQVSPLADLHSEWAEHHRGHMRQFRLLGAYKLLFDSQLALGDHHAVLARLAPLIDEYELDDTLARQWIIALDGSGRYYDACIFYTNYRRRCIDAVAAEPAREVSDAYHQILDKRNRSEQYDVDNSDSRALAQFLPPRQLPRDISDFIGHDALIDEIDALVGATDFPAGVVIINGMPGIGKTTLAIHWAYRHRDHFPDGQLYLNASAYGPSAPVDPADAVGRFLHALGMPVDRIPPTGEQRHARLSQLLVDRRILILLDNVRDPQQVRPILAATSNCFVLITSRNKLKGLTIRDGVRSITVPPLAEKEATALLRAAINSRRADEEREGLNSLAALSGGLPLALRIIGQYVAERPRSHLADLVDKLRRRLLASEDEIDDEDATLRTVFAWSYDDLPTDAARLFRLLGLHPGWTISAEVAAALIGAGIEQVDRLLDLIAKANLIEHDAANGYRFHDLLRLYAAVRVRDEEALEQQHAARERLLDWYLLSASNAAAVIAPHRPLVPDLPTTSTVEPVRFETESDAMRWCERERANLTAVTRYAAEHGFYNHAWQIPGVVHEFFERYGSQDDVLECQEIALASARIAGHYEGHVGTLNNLGGTCLDLMDYERAAAYFEEGLQLARAKGHQPGQAVCLLNLGNVHRERGNIRAALDLYKKSAKEYRDVADSSGEAFTLHGFGTACRRMKRYDDALIYYRQALALRERIGHLRGQGISHTDLAALYLELGDHDSAREHAQRAFELHSHTRDQAMTCEALITMAAVDHSRGLFDDAIHNAELAAKLSEVIGGSRRRALALGILANALAPSGDHEMARQVWLEQLEIFVDLADPEATNVRARIVALDEGTHPAPAQRTSEPLNAEDKERSW